MLLGRSGWNQRFVQTISSRYDLRVWDRVMPSCLVPLASFIATLFHMIHLVIVLTCVLAQTASRISLLIGKSVDTPRVFVSERTGMACGPAL
jgi:hypothetical protein